MLEPPQSETAAGGPPVGFSLLAVRGAVGGVLMGLANLVPGISGGTMLLATGIYPHFIRAVAEVSTFRLRPASVVVLISVGLAAAAGIVLLAGPIKELVVHHRWIMYSLFIGLTLGGVPVLWRMIRPPTPAVFWGAAVGLGLMIALAVFQSQVVLLGGRGGNNIPMLILAGLAGASAMILPGVSGGYLLLVLGQYVPILSAVDAVKTAVAGGVFQEALAPALGVLLPVALGIVVGVIGVSNLLRWLLQRFEKATLGVLLGLLLGAVVGLWPFQQTQEPVLGKTVIKGRLVTAENRHEFEAEDYPLAFFRPTAAQGFAALGFVGAGAAATLLITRIGRERPTTSG